MRTKCWDFSRPTLVNEHLKYTAARQGDVLSTWFGQIKFWDPSFKGSSRILLTFDGQFWLGSLDTCFCAEIVRQVSSLNNFKVALNPAWENPTLNVRDVRKRWLMLKLAKMPITFWSPVKHSLIIRVAQATGGKCGEINGENRDALGANLVADLNNNHWL